MVTDSLERLERPSGHQGERGSAGLPAIARALLVGWALGGVLMLLGRAVWRMVPLAVEPIKAGTVTQGHLAWYAVSIVLMSYSEGYRAFHRRFSPRTVHRALYLAQQPRLLWVLLAPLYSMGLVGATRRRLAVSWMTTAAIVVFIVVLRATPQPWRGIIDAGVAVALACGMLSIVYHLGQALSGRGAPGSLDLPPSRPRAGAP